MEATDAVIAEFSVSSLQLDAITMSLGHDDSLVTGNSDWILNSETYELMSIRCGQEENQKKKKMKQKAIVG